MCTIRGIWLISEKDDLFFEVLFSRRYPTVESRVRLYSGSNYISVPSDIDLSKLFKSDVIEGAKSKEISAHVGSIKNGSIWPVVYLRRNGIYFVTINVIEEYYRTGTKPSLITLPSVTGSLSLLEDISLMAGPNLLKLGKNSLLLAELTVFLSSAIPFGQPVDTQVDTVKTMVKQGFPAADALVQKRPAWKPYLFKGKQQIELRMQEVIDCVMYDNPNRTDAWNVSGRIVCKAELEGLPEVTVFFTLPPEICHMAVDPSVQTIADVLTTNKISFTPPIEPFSLCSYGMKPPKKMPLRGFYQMKELGDNVVKLLIQLKLDEEVNNYLEYCQLLIPFKNRGNIINVLMSPTAGTITLTPNHRALLWNIGQKFTGRHLEVALPAEISFEGASLTSQGFLPPIASISPGDPWAFDADDFIDPFCVGLSSYVKLYFKILNCTLSGMNIDSKKLSIFPNVKAKVIVEREVISSEYIIWNSLGDSRYAVKPPDTNTDDASVT